MLLFGRLLLLTANLLVVSALGEIQDYCHWTGRIKGLFSINSKLVIIYHQPPGVVLRFRNRYFYEQAIYSNDCKLLMCHSKLIHHRIARYEFCGHFRLPNGLVEEEDEDSLTKGIHAFYDRKERQYVFYTATANVEAYFEQKTLHFDPIKSQALMELSKRLQSLQLKACVPVTFDPISRTFVYVDNSKHRLHLWSVPSNHSNDFAILANPIGSLFYFRRQISALLQDFDTIFVLKEEKLWRTVSSNFDFQFSNYFPECFNQRHASVYLQCKKHSHSNDTLLNLCR